MNIKFFSLLFICFLVSSCATDVANRYYSSKKYPPKKVEEVLILREKPKKAFIVIADFQSRGESDKTFVKRAAEIGADAVIITSVGGYYSMNEESANDDRYKNEYYDHKIATAIKYKTKGE